MTENITILTLLDRDGICTKRESGRELSTSCPWCGGRDRFRIWPDEEGGGGFWCRVCGKSGDMVKYHMLTTAMGYADACHDLGVKPKRGRRKKVDFEYATLPPMRWRKQAADVIESAHSALLSAAGEPLRSYLADRGIDDTAIKLTKLGINLSAQWHDRSVWGLEEQTNEETGKPKKVWIPDGLIIPCMIDGEPIRIRVRRDTSPRYVTVTGSSKQPLRFGHTEGDVHAAVVVESDLDAILLSRLAGDLVMVVSLGSAATRPDKETHKYLQSAKRILLSLDYDEAGGAQWSWWHRQYGARVKCWPVNKGKDPGEAFQQGVNLRRWIEAGLLK